MITRIGLCGRAGSGKDTIAEFLKEEGWVQDSFAADLKKMAYDLNPWVRLLMTKGTSGCPLAYEFIKLQDLIQEVGIDEAKQHPDVRSFYQRLGTECVRENLGEDFWVNRVLERVSTSEQSVVISDVRFPNEAEALREAGFKLIWILRPGLDKVNNHISENDKMSDYCQHAINNNGTIEDLREKLWDRMVRWE